MESVGALILANPGTQRSDDSSNSEDAAVHLKGVVSDYNWLTQFMGDLSGVDVSGCSVCDAFLKKAEAVDRVQKFLRKPRSFYIIAYVGHGRPGSGNWIMDDGDITFNEVNEIWKCSGYVPQLGDNCLLISDCCYSGRWVEDAAEMRAPMIVQSSVSANKRARDCRDMTFTLQWIRLQTTNQFPRFSLRKLQPLCYCSANSTPPVIGGITFQLVGEPRLQAKSYLRLRYSAHCLFPGSAIEFIWDHSCLQEFNPGVAPKSIWTVSARHALGNVGHVQAIALEDRICVKHVEVAQYCRRARVGTRLLFELCRQHPAISQIEVAIADDCEAAEAAVSFFTSLGFRPCSDQSVPVQRSPKQYIFLRSLPSKISLSWDDPNLVADVSDMFVDTFLDLYRDISPTDLGIATTKEEWLQSTFDGELQIKREDPARHPWLIARDGDNVMGLLIMELGDTRNPDVGASSCYVRQLAIVKSHQRRGLGYAMAKTVTHRYPSLSLINAVTRVINNRSHKFLEHIGCKKSDYCHSQYDPDKYVGYTLDFQKPEPAANSERLLENERHRSSNSEIDELSEQDKLEDQRNMLHTTKFTWDTESRYSDSMQMFLRCLRQAYADYSTKELGTAMPLEQWLDEISKQELLLKMLKLLHLRLFQDAFKRMGRSDALLDEDREIMEAWHETTEGSPTDILTRFNEEFGLGGGLAWTRTTSTHPCAEMCYFAQLPEAIISNVSHFGGPEAIVSIVQSSRKCNLYKTALLPLRLQHRHQCIRSIALEAIASLDFDQYLAAVHSAGHAARAHAREANQHLLPCDDLFAQR